MKTLHLKKPVSRGRTWNGQLQDKVSQTLLLLEWASLVTGATETNSLQRKNK